MACRGRSGGLPRPFSFWPSILCQAGKDPCEKPTESASLIEEFFSGTDRFGGGFPGRLVGYWSCCDAQNDRRRTGMRCGYRLPCELLEGAIRRSSADCACAQKQKDAREDAPDWIAGEAVVTAAIGGLVAIIALAPRAAEADRRACAATYANELPEMDRRAGLAAFAQAPAWQTLTCGSKTPADPR